MIELPEAATLSRQLNDVLSGKRVARTVANQSPHGFAFYHGDPSEYPARLDGKTVGRSASHGGRIVVEVEDMRLQFFDGVNLRLLTPAQERPKKHQLLLEFEDGTALCCTVQMYGGLFAYPRDTDLGFYANVAMEKPSPLSSEFDRAYFDSLFEGVKPSLSAKALLATEQRIPGLGNGVLQDILFQAHVHPKARALELGDARRDALFRSVKGVLRAMKRGGGRDTEKDLFGNAGGYRSILSGKTLKDPCPVCGGAIVRQAYLGGNVYFCPSCQPL